MSRCVETAVRVVLGSTVRCDRAVGMIAVMLSFVGLVASADTIGPPDDVVAIDCPDLPDPAWPTCRATDQGVIADDGLDDTAALQAAIEGRGTVYLPPGQIDCFDDVLMRSDVALCGVQGSTLRMHDATLRMTDVSRVALIGFEIVGDGAAFGGPTLVSLTAHVEDMLLERMTLRDAPHDAIHALRECRRLCWIDSVVDGAGDDGLNPGGGGPGEGTNAVLIQGNVVRNVAHDGIHVSVKSFDVTVLDNVVEHCGRGVGLIGCRDSLVSGTLISNCGDGMATIACCGYDRTPGMRVIGNTTDGSTIRVDGTCTVIVDNDAPVVDAGFALAYGNESIDGHTPGDLNCDEVVGVRDLVSLLWAWGPVEELDRADLDGSGVVDVDDLVMLLEHWTGR
jgi:hypothetical protein